MLLLLMFLAAAIAYEIQNQVFRHWYEKGLTVKVNFQKDYIEEGQQAQLCEVIENRKWMPLPVVHVSFHTGNGLEFKNQKNINVSDTTSRREVFSLLWNQRVTRKLTFQGKRRGHYYIKTADINVYNFLMTRKYYIEQEQHTEIYVYPRHIPTDRLQMLLQRVYGMQQAQDRFYEDVLSFAGIREYVPGDEQKRVNQKASARAGKLMVNVYDSVKAQKVVILLEVSDKGIWKQQKLAEEGIALAASLSHRLLQAGSDVALYSNGMTQGKPVAINFGKDSGKLHTIYRCLADMDLSKEVQSPQEMIEQAVADTKGSSGLYLLLSKNVAEGYSVRLKEQVLKEKEDATGNPVMQVILRHPSLTKEPEEIPAMDGVQHLVWEVEG